MHSSKQITLFLISICALFAHCYANKNARDGLMSQAYNDLFHLGFNI